MRVDVNAEGNLTTLPKIGNFAEESEGYVPADFDRRITALGEDGDEIITAIVTPNGMRAGAKKSAPQ